MGQAFWMLHLLAEFSLSEVKMLSQKFSTAISFVALATLAGLAGCNSTDTASNVENTLNVQQTQQAGNLPVADEIQDIRAYCPKIVLREGTETFNIYQDGVKAEDDGAAKLIKYRATITDTVRECNSAGQFLNIKVGIKGRYLSGPKSDVGSFNMPIRVAVTRGDEVLYSQLHQVYAEIPVGRTNGAFAYVDKNISILKPDSPNILIYVGYDEGPYTE